MLKECKRCLMNATVKDLVLNDQGICNYCIDFSNRAESLIQKDSTTNSQSFNDFLYRVKKNGKGKKYDCIIGVSGGVDSSYVLIKAVQ
jgi:hypothetical protein